MAFLEARVRRGIGYPHFGLQSTPKRDQSLPSCLRDTVLRKWLGADGYYQLVAVDIRLPLASCLSSLSSHLISSHVLAVPSRFFSNVSSNSRSLQPLLTPPQPQTLIQRPSKDGTVTLRGRYAGSSYNRSDGDLHI